MTNKNKKAIKRLEGVLEDLNDNDFSVGIPQTGAIGKLIEVDLFEDSIKTIQLALKALIDTYKGGDETKYTRSTALDKFMEELNDTTL